MADSTHVCSAHAVMQVYTIVVAVIACLDARAVSRRDARAARIIVVQVKQQQPMAMTGGCGGASGERWA